MKSNANFNYIKVNDNLRKIEIQRSLLIYTHFYHLILILFIQKYANYEQENCEFFFLFGFWESYQQSFRNVFKIEIKKKRKMEYCLVKYDKIDYNWKKH